MIFEDLRILDLSQFISGPWCTTFFADQGADVIKVETPPFGESFRYFLLFDKTFFPLFSILNRGKKSISLNLRKKGSQEIFLKLVEKTDVVVENFVRGTMEKWGLGYKQLKEINPSLIYAKISGYGNEGLEEYINKTAFDIIIQAEAGILDALDLKEGPPKLPIADYSAGHVAAIGISQALYHREKSGEGQFIDISMHDIMFSINIRAQAKEFMPMSKNLDLGSKFLPIYNQYDTIDGKIVLTTLTEKQWQRLVVDVLKEPQLLKDPKLNNPIKRFNHVDLLDNYVQKWAIRHTMDEAIKKLEEQRIPCGKKYSMLETPFHPNLAARGMIKGKFDFSKWNVEKASIPNRLINFSKTKGEVSRPGPDFGEHNEEVYCDLLGYSKESLKEWKRKGLI